MQDWYALLRESIVNIAAACPGVSLRASQIECPAGGNTLAGVPGGAAFIAARSAAPLACEANAAAWAAMLQGACLQAGDFPGGWRLESVLHSGGHLLFLPDAAFYTLALRDVLASLPPVQNPGYTGEAHTLPGRVRYARQRMWMLARKAGDAPAYCPPYPAVQRGLWLALAIAERPARPLTNRALELRMQEAAEALLTMTYGEPPRNRPALLADCAHVAAAAAQLLGWGLHKTNNDLNR